MNTNREFWNVRNRRVFVIGPIREENSDTRKRSDDILERLIKPAVLDCGFEEPLRADRLAEPGSITDAVIQHLIEDDLVIADLNDHNPNVFYELGVRHTTGKPCIQIAKKGDQIPFDVNSLRTIFLDTADIRSWEDAKTKIVAQIKFIQQNPEPGDSAVTVAFELLKLRRNQGLLDIFSMMEPTRPIRGLIRQAVRDGKTWKDLSTEDLSQVDELCRKYDLLGMYDRLGIVNSFHVDFIYSVPLVELYESFLGEYIEYLRNGSRGKTHFWELVKFYERVRFVPGNHPAITSKDDWPENPRLKRN